MNGKIEVDRGRMVGTVGWASLEHATEVWLTLGQIACRKFNSDERNKKSIRISNTGRSNRAVGLRVEENGDS